MASIQVLVPADPYPPCADTNRDGDPAPKWLREGLLGHSSLVDDPVADDCDPDPFLKTI